MAASLVERTAQAFRRAVATVGRSIADARRSIATHDRAWLTVALAVGLVLAVPTLVWTPESIGEHALKLLGTLFLVPLVVARLGGRSIGWRVDRRAVRNAVALTALVVPIYVVGSSLPTVRAYYPLWSPEASIVGFLPYALAMGAIIVATETYYRGLLCVGLRHLGVACVFVSPTIYTLWHLHHPPIELLLSAPADVAFGYVDYRSESILPSVSAHAIGFILLMWLVMHPPIVPQSIVRGVLEAIPMLGV